jgi:hypothetical protein
MIEAMAACQCSQSASTLIEDDEYHLTPREWPASDCAGPGCQVYYTQAIELKISLPNSMMYEIEALPRTQIYFSHSARTALH